MYNFTDCRAEAGTREVGCSLQGFVTRDGQTYLLILYGTKLGLSRSIGHTTMASSVYLAVLLQLRPLSQISISF